MSVNKNEIYFDRLIESQRTVKTMVEHFGWSAEKVAEYWEVSKPVAIAFLADIDSFAAEDDFDQEESSDQEVSSKSRRGPERLKLPVKKIIKDYRAGLTLEALANRYQVSVNTITNRLRAANEPRRATGKKKHDF